MSLSVYQKERIERRAMGRKTFQTRCKRQISNAFSVFRLYITYTLDGFLFDLDQSNICRDIQKIERLIRKCVPIPQKIYNITKRLQTPDEIEKYFPGFMSFIDCHRTTDSRPIDKRRRKIILFWKEEKTYCKESIMVNNHGYYHLQNKP